jgi:hypothetical protein
MSGFYNTKYEYCDNWLLLIVISFCSYLFWFVVITTFLIQSIEKELYIVGPIEDHNVNNECDYNKNNDDVDYEPNDDSDSDYEPEYDDEDDDDDDYEPEHDELRHIRECEIKKILCKALRNVRNTRELIERVLVK